MKEKILAALGKVIDPDLKNDLVSLNMINDLKIEGKKVCFTITLTTPACPLKNRFRDQCTMYIHQDVDKDLEVEITFDAKVRNDKRASQEKMPGVKNLIAIASGKGGVGKSTVSVNIALALAQFGAKVGLLDADINGPNLQIMMGLQGMQPLAKAVGTRTLMKPVEKFGIKVISLGMMVPASQPIVWRGPMLSNAFQQLCLDTDWEELDYLIFDLPPGTGDIHITLCQQLPITAVVMVTTPQKVSHSDTMKTIEMFKMDNIKIPLLGIVENMSYFTPAELPDKKYYIFGKGAATELSEKYNIPVLGELPIVDGVADKSDKGLPIMMDEGNPLIPVFNDIAQKIAQALAILNAQK